MEKRGTTHIELVLAFIMFIGAIFLIFYYFRPLSAYDYKLPDERASLDLLKRYLEVNMNITVLMVDYEKVYPAANPTGNRKVLLNLTEGMSNYPFVYAKDKAGAPTPISFAYPSDPNKFNLVYLDVEDSFSTNADKAYFTIYSSSEAFDPAPIAASGTAYDDSNGHLILAQRTWQGVSYQNATTLSLSSIRTKEALGIDPKTLSDGSFSLTLPDFDEVSSSATPPDEETQLYSRAHLVEVFKGNGLYPGMLQVTLW